MNLSLENKEDILDTSFTINVKNTKIFDDLEILYPNSKVYKEPLVGIKEVSLI